MTMSDLIRREDAINAVAVAVLDDRDELEAIKAIPSVQVSGDLISRQDAIEAVESLPNTPNGYSDTYDKAVFIEILEELPSAEGGDADMTVIPEGTGLMQPCPDNGADLISRADAKQQISEWATIITKPTLLDKDATMLVLDSLPSADAVQGWIPCSERFPKAEDMYQPPEQRYLCQLEAYGVRKFCVLSRLKGAVSPFWDWYGVAIHDSEVTAWMPLPTPYKGGDSE